MRDIEKHFRQKLYKGGQITQINLKKNRFLRSHKVIIIF